MTFSSKQIIQKTQNKEKQKTGFSIKIGRKCRLNKNP